MGFFSWNTSDTQRSIANNYSKRDTFKVHMVTKDGGAYTEENYEGYGEFGGKDFYELLAELNGKKTRDEGIELAFGKRYITNGEKKYYANGIDFWYWDKALESEGKCPNDLIEDGWKSDVEMEDGVEFPKLVEHLPLPSHDWERWFSLLPESDDCPEQGYFYDENYEDDYEEDYY